MWIFAFGSQIFRDVDFLPSHQSLPFVFGFVKMELSVESVFQNNAVFCNKCFTDLTMICCGNLLVFCSNIAFETNWFSDISRRIAFFLTDNESLIYSCDG